MSNFKVLYIEDNEKDFQDIRRFLESSNFEIFPKQHDFHQFLELCREYIKDSTKENKLALESFIENVHPNVIIIDLGLGVNEYGFGDKIHRDILMKAADLKEIPVVYLTVAEETGLPLDHHTRYVFKNRGPSGYDKQSTFLDLLSEINSLLPGSRGKLAKNIDDNF